MRFDFRVIRAARWRLSMPGTQSGHVSNSPMEPKITSGWCVTRPRLTGAGGGQMTCAMAVARRSVATLAQLRTSAPANTMAPLATAENAKRSKKYCNQITKT